MEQIDEGKKTIISNHTQHFGDSMKLWLWRGKKEEKNHMHLCPVRMLDVTFIYCNISRFLKII